MAICVPKHIICNWYTPSFIPGTANCVLQSYNEVRARLVSGGTFFRSIEPGSKGNNIELKVTWEYQDGSGNWIETIIDTEVQRVHLYVYYKGNLVEEFTAPQDGADDGMGNFVWNSGIPDLRNTVNNNSNYITMPTIDVQQPWDSSTDDQDHLGHFDTTSLTGGVAGPSDPSSVSPPIRTGPYYDLILISSSEVPNGPIPDKLNNGSMVDVNRIYYWNGACWLDFSLDCYDPENLPPGFDCSGGPSTQC